MILTVDSLDEVSPARRKQEYHQLAYKIAKSVSRGEYRTLDEAIESWAARLRVTLSDEDFQAIKNIAVRIR